MTLLELVIAGTMLAVIGSSLSVVLRTARLSWDADNQDHQAMHQLHVVALHFTRQTRLARSVNDLAADGSAIELAMRDGTTSRWSLQAVGPNGLTDVVMFENSTMVQAEPLGSGIRNLQFVGYEADGSVATDIDDIRRIEMVQTVLLQRTQHSQQSLRTFSWIRSW